MSGAADEPKDEAAKADRAPAAKPVPLFGAGAGPIAFGAVTEDAEAMCVWDGDAVVCTPVTTDKD
ncbi:MAG: hypothetical protein IT534_11815 [Bauldia sp.]|jgi:hypothetical protein|nr:hypothetical protein [Bauldia sp.]